MVTERLNEKENDEDFDEDLYCLELQKSLNGLLLTHETLQGSIQQVIIIKSPNNFRIDMLSKSFLAILKQFFDS